jgi:hypothetical protein
MELKPEEIKEIKKEKTLQKKKTVLKNVVVNTCNARHELELLKDIIKQNKWGT